jgi:FMN phosphatase YigB (HAD superfamily)
MHFTVFSSEVGYRKPSDRIFEAAFEKLYPDGQQRDLSRVVFVGDAPRLDVQAAAALGMRTALVNRPAGSWPAEDYAQARPDWRINRVAELPELLGI